MARSLKLVNNDYIDSSGIIVYYPGRPEERITMNDFINRSFIDNGTNVTSRDLNSIPNGGTWVNNLYGEYDNAPSQDAYIVFQYSVYQLNYKAQIAIEFSNNSFYVRTFNNINWTAWKRIY